MLCYLAPVTAPLLLWSIALLLVTLGLLGLLLPVLPGTPLLFAGLVVGAWADGFTRIGWPTLLGLGLLTLVSVAVDLLAPAVGVQKLGASHKAFAGATVGAFVGLFFGFPGILCGPFIGAVLGEYWAVRDLRRAGTIGFGAWLGLLIGGAAKIAIAFAMLGWFALALVL